MGQLHDLLQDFFPARIRARGNNYYHEGRVREVQALDGVIAANVRGSHMYCVYLVVDEFGVQAGCDCPWALAHKSCKHIWA